MVEADNVWHSIDAQPSKCNTVCEAQGSDKVVPSLMGAIGEADAHTVGKHREKGAVCSVTRALLQDNGRLEMGSLCQHFCTS